MGEIPGDQWMPLEGKGAEKKGRVGPDGPPFPRRSSLNWTLFTSHDGSRATLELPLQTKTNCPGHHLCWETVLEVQGVQIQGGRTCPRSQSCLRPEKPGLTFEVLPERDPAMGGVWGRTSRVFQVFLPHTSSSRNPSPASLALLGTRHGYLWEERQGAAHPGHCRDPRGVSGRGQQP